MESPSRPPRPSDSVRRPGIPTPDHVYGAARTAAAAWCRAHPHPHSVLLIRVTWPVPGTARRRRESVFSYDPRTGELEHFLLTRDVEPDPPATEAAAAAGSPDSDPSGSERAAGCPGV